MSIAARSSDEPGVACHAIASVGRSTAERSASEANDRRIDGVAIEMRDLTKAFGQRVVLNTVDLTIEPGQFVAIVGRSGGGKTTLLRLISGLDQPSSGAVSIEGATVAGVQKAARIMFQDARLLPWQRVISNVGIARSDNWRVQAAQALKAVGLADRAQDWPYVLSGGQRQRVALARALVSTPKILLLDEPFGALDALTRADMHRLLLELWTERGFTSILITHDVAEAVALADRVLVLRDGRIVVDLMVEQPRPRRGGAESLMAQLKERVLAEVWPRDGRALKVAGGLTAFPFLPLLWTEQRRLLGLAEPALVWTWTVDDGHLCLITSASKSAEIVSEFLNRQEA